jgi:predicted transcriptional regulator of viral defense system
MQSMKTRLGRQESAMLAYLQLRKKRTVRMGELTGPLRLSPAQERELFRRMLRGQMIARVRPGLFLVPATLPLGSAWTPSPAQALTALMEDRKGRYQICGPNAFNRYGFDDQVPNRVFAYNTRISGDRMIGAVSLILIKVATRRLGETVVATTPDGEREVWASRVRTLVDAVYDWARFNSLPRGFGWIRQELRARRVSAADLVATTLHFGDKATIRRIGWVLEQEGIAVPLLRKLERALPPSSTLVPLNPMRSKRGRADRRWGVVVNEGV